MNPDEESPSKSSSENDEKPTTDQTSEETTTSENEIPTSEEESDSTSEAPVDEKDETSEPKSEEVDSSDETAEKTDAPSEEEDSSDDSSDSSMDNDSSDDPEEATLTPNGSSVHAPGSSIEPSLSSEILTQDAKEENAPQLGKDSVAATSSDEPVVAKEPKTKKTKNLIILLVLIILLIIVAIAGFFIHKHNKDQSGTSGEKTVQHITLGIYQGDLGTTFYPNPVPLAGTSLMYSQIFDGLVQYENQNQIVPDLASGWVTPNSTTWLFTLKSGVKFHDGHALTPADVVYSLNLMKKLSTGNNSYAQEFATTLKTIQAVGTNQVKITTTVPDPVLLNKLSFLYIVDHDLPKGENPTMAATGAYELKPGTKLTDTNVQLVAFNSFHGGPVLTKSLTIDDIKANSSTFVNGLKNHEYNIIGEARNADMHALNTYAFTEQDDTVSFIGMNTTHAPLNNILVREAIRYAINPVTLLPTQNVTPIGQLIPPSILGYNPNITPVGQNIAKAKQLLAQAGYSKGLSLTMADVTGNAADPYIISQLKQVGITVTITGSPTIDGVVNSYLNGTGELSDLSYGSDTLDGADVLGSIMVPANYPNPKLYALIKQATTTIDPPTRIKILQQAETIISQNAAIEPLSYNENLYLMDKPYVLHQDLPALYTSVYFYKVHLKG
jgi:peptide/nickel transport system substrate-binding protein